MACYSRQSKLKIPAVDFSHILYFILQSNSLTWITPSMACYSRQSKLKIPAVDFSPIFHFFTTKFSLYCCTVKPLIKESTPTPLRNHPSFKTTFLWNISLPVWKYTPDLGPSIFHDQFAWIFRLVFKKAVSLYFWVVCDKVLLWNKCKACFQPLFLLGGVGGGGGRLRDFHCSCSMRICKSVMLPHTLRDLCYTW